MNLYLRKTNSFVFKMETLKLNELLNQKNTLKKTITIDKSTPNLICLNIFI
jgi:hypothetical protein